MEPVNLRERFGKRYRIGFDPSRSSAWDHDLWMMTVRCRYGEIYPHGETTLAVDVEGHGKIAAQLAALPCVTVHRPHTFLFDVEDFDKVAAIVAPRRRRQLTQEQRERLSETGREALRKLHSQSSSAARKRTISKQVG
jgi:hypothetical protein